jgi:hypothetical protein
MPAALADAAKASRSEPGFLNHDLGALEGLGGKSILIRLRADFGV